MKDLHMPENSQSETLHFEKINDADLFEDLFSHEGLLEVFDEKFRNSTGKGLDRLNGLQFAMRAEDQLSASATRCRLGSYRFAPYLEVLKTKGRTKLPRVIGIPTIRDRVILSQLNKFLATIFHDRVPRNVAAMYVRTIAEDLGKKPIKSTWVCTTDIKTFYDSIQRDRLLAVLAKRIKHQPALSLISHALQTPTVPKNTPRKNHSEFRSNIGIPQGLAISNILASIYMEPIDEAMPKLNISYYRYVDDVLIYGDQKQVNAAFKSLSARLKLRGMSLHTLNSGKSQIKNLSHSFGYLGYVFEGNSISVRDATVERFLQSIANKFSEFIHNKQARLSKFTYLTEKRSAEIFLMELNEKITGAIKANRKYGWIAYFNQITDLTLLHRIDHTIRSLFSRLKEFDYKHPSNLKSLRRAYWEMKYNPQGGYISDYDKISSPAQKLQFLVKRGRVNEKEGPLTDEQIDARFDSYVNYNLAAMHADEGAIYT
jgi:RNA-directed DNA polymerase